jgi:hypothetical protein
MVLPQMQRQRPEVVARAHQDVEGVELDLVIVLAAVQAVEVGDAVDAEQQALALLLAPKAEAWVAVALDEEPKLEAWMAVAWLS